MLRASEPALPFWPFKEQLWPRSYPIAVLANGSCRDSSMKGRENAYPGETGLQETGPLKMYGFINMQKYANMKGNVYTSPARKGKIKFLLEVASCAALLPSVCLFYSDFSVVLYTIALLLFCCMCVCDSLFKGGNIQPL